MDNKTKILIASFFHDIGKFQQRGISLGERLRHQEYSSGFVNGLFNDQMINNMADYYKVHEKADKIKLESYSPISSRCGVFKSRRSAECESDF